MYKDHKEIPTIYRRVILQETLEKRVSKVPLVLCNDIIERHLEEMEENATLKNYEIEYIKGGKRARLETVGRQATLVQLDRILEYGENKDPNVVIAVSQAKRLIDGYVNCQWIHPDPKDKLRVLPLRRVV
jgi:hypothetical protein|tara:strand:- start:11568 stop:11957 length:390 start_codon:yes stop_codon:yes gene_type:complete